MLRVRKEPSSGDAGPKRPPGLAAAGLCNQRVHIRKHTDTHRHIEAEADTHATRKVRLQQASRWRIRITDKKHEPKRGHPPFGCLRRRAWHVSQTRKGTAAVHRSLQTWRLGPWCRHQQWPGRCLTASSVLCTSPTRERLQLNSCNKSNTRTCFQICFSGGNALFQSHAHVGRRLDFGLAFLVLALLVFALFLFALLFGFFLTPQLKVKRGTTASTVNSCSSPSRPSQGNHRQFRKRTGPWWQNLHVRAVAVDSEGKCCVVNRQQEVDVPP